jgi:hypothetical protein
MRANHAARLWTAVACLLLAVSAGGCARDVVPAGGVRVTGRLVDDTTGKDVPRREFWVHGFSDSVKKQVSLSSAPEPTFSLVLPARDVRLRIADGSNQYRLYEQRFTATSDVLDVEVRLVPTGYVRLHGRVLVRDGARVRPPPITGQMGFMPRVHVGPAGLDYREDGSYSARVPRELLAVRTINTPLGIHPKEVDLRGVTTDDHALDFVLGK